MLAANALGHTLVSRFFIAGSAAQEDDLQEARNENDAYTNLLPCG